MKRIIRLKLTHKAQSFRKLELPFINNILYNTTTNRVCRMVDEEGYIRLIILTLSPQQNLLIY